MAPGGFTPKQRLAMAAWFLSMQIAKNWGIAVTPSGDGYGL
jgi:hypothetical protein